MAPSKTPQLHGNPAPRLRLVQVGFRASAENDTGAFQGTPAPAEGETAALEADFFSPPVSASLMSQPLPLPRG